MTCKCEHWQVCDECRPVRFPKTEDKAMTKELLQQALNEARSTAITVFTHVDGLARETKDAIEYMYSLLSMHFERQALAQQEQCGCREGECETKKDKTCRMTIEIAERDGIPEWTPAIGIECAISNLRDDAARLRGGNYMRIQIADDLEVIANDLAKCKPDAQQEQPASVDAYNGAREDVAIWKKRALEAEELNRKFIAELNGPTYLGEPAQQEQPAQGKCKCGHVGTSITVVESFPVHSVSVDEEDPDYKEHYYGLDVDATLQIGLEICRNCKTINGFWIEDTGGAEFYADWGKPRYTHPAPTQPAQEASATWTEMVAVNLVREGVNKHRARELAAHFLTLPTQPALSESQITSIAYNCNALPEVITDKTLVDFVRAIEAHCRGGNHG